MRDAIAAAAIAGFASLTGSVLILMVGIRQIRRSMSTSNGEPLGHVVEARLDQIERRLDGLDRALGEVREWLAYREGRDRPTFWRPRTTS
jgi:hypothetical protein